MQALEVSQQALCWRAVGWKDPSSCKRPNGPFELSEDFQWKLKKPKDSSPPPVTESSTTMVYATQSTIAQIFEWQKVCSYEKHLRIVAYMLRLLDKNSLYRWPSVAITEPAEQNNAEQGLFYNVQCESFACEKLFYWNPRHLVELPK